jgi:membrane-associated phospholipid phosphatase
LRSVPAKWGTRPPRHCQEPVAHVVTTMPKICSVAFVVAVIVVGQPGRALAQSGRTDAGVPPPGMSDAIEGQDLPVAERDVQPASASLGPSPSLVNPTLAATFTSVGGDLRRMFSKGSVGMGVAFVGSALTAAHWDGATVGEIRELPSGLFKPGNTTGALVTQMGAAFGTFAIGKATGNARVATVGSHLIRAQVASQVVVQGLKLVAERSRPDASNHFSFPSGHTASAFATATVLQRDFGWKVGLPAYAAGAYVAAARMSSNKHYLSDVIIGAAVGVTAGRAVTVGAGRIRFDLGVAPTAGGAAVTFTKK